MVCGLSSDPKELLALKILYVIHFAAFSPQTYFTAFYDSTRHYSKFQIGVLQTLRCVCSLMSPPFWGAVADLMGNQRRIHLYCLVGALLFMFSMRFVQSFETMCVVALVSNFLTQPTYSLLDQTTMTWITKIGAEYGKQRLFGAIGWGSGAAFTGLCIAFGGMELGFDLMLVLGCVDLYLLLYCIPTIEELELIENDDEMEEPLSPPVRKTSFWQNLKRVVHQPDVLVLFVLVFFIGSMSGLMGSFLMLYLYELSGNQSFLLGIAVALETASELPLFFYSNRILANCGTALCIAFGLVAYGIRFGSYILTTNAWRILPVEMLHGVTFGLVWAAFTNYVYKAAPRGTQGIMMGTLTAVQSGLGGGFGTLFGGYLYQTQGPRAMWTTGLGGVPLCLFIVAAFSYLSQPHTSRRSSSASSSSSSSSSSVAMAMTRFSKFSAAVIDRRLPDYGTIAHLEAGRKDLLRR